MNPGEIYYLLGRCLAMDDFPVYQLEISGMLSKKDFPWDSFVHAGSNNLVLPALYQKLNSCGLMELIPPDLSDHLESVYQLNENRNDQILDQAEQINEACKKAGINPVFIKGVAALASGVYTHPAERMLWDIDCVIPESQVMETVGILKTEGYTHAAYREEDMPFMHHFPTLSRAGSVAPVDLHFAPVAGRYDRFLLNWEDRTSIAHGLPNSHIETVGTGDMAMLNFLHSQVQDHGDYYARVSLKNLYEFYRVTRSGGLYSMNQIQRGSMYRKVKNYEALTELTFYPPSSRSIQYGFITRIFLKRFDLNKSNRFYHNLSRISRQIFFQAGYYLSLLFKAIIQKNYRRYFIARITDRAWSRTHFRHLRRMFGGAPNQ